MQNKLFLTCFLALFAFAAYGQVDLINKVKDNQSENAKEGFQWTDVYDIERTEVKNQGASGTCWSYSSNSFLESEMVKKGKKPVDIAEMYTVRRTYEEKADRYVRMHGNLNFGQGGALPDVTDMFKKYGAIPQSLYSGLNYGEDINRHGELDGILKGILDAVIENYHLFGKTLSVLFWMFIWGKYQRHLSTKVKNIHQSRLVKITWELTQMTTCKSLLGHTNRCTSQWLSWCLTTGITGCPTMCKWKI